MSFRSPPASPPSLLLPAQPPPLGPRGHAFREAAGLAGDLGVTSCPALGLWLEERALEAPPLPPPLPALPVGLPVVGV